MLLLLGPVPALAIACRYIPCSFPLQIIKVVSKGGRLPIPDQPSLPGGDTKEFSGLHTYIALLQRCWTQDPANRPTFAEIVGALRWV